MKMFKQYNSIDDLLKYEKVTIINEFNQQPLYYKIVKALGLTEIGITVLDNDDRIIGSYASYNGSDGKVIDIVPYQKSPNIIASAKEMVLLGMIQNAEMIKAHPKSSFFKYGPYFKMRKKDYLTLLNAVMRINIF